MNSKEKMFILGQKDDGSREVAKGLLSFIRGKWGGESAEEAIDEVEEKSAKFQGK